MMWSNNRFVEDLKAHCQKAKSQKINHKELQPILITIQSCLNSNVQATQYQKIINYFVEIFVASLHLLPHDGLYRCFRGVIQCGANQSKTQKAYLLIKNVVQICERVFQQPKDSRHYYPEDKELKMVLSLVKKSGEKEFGTDIMSVFLSYYLERIQRQISDKQSQKLGSFVLSQLTNMLLTRYKNHSLLFIKKQLTSVSTLYPLFVLLEFEHNLGFMPLLLENQTQPFSYSAFFKANPSEEVELFVYKKFMANFVYCLRQNVNSVLLMLHNLFPVRAKNNLTAELLLEKVYLDTFIHKTGLFLLPDSQTKVNSDGWREKEQHFVQNFGTSLLGQQKISLEYYWKLATLFVVIFKDQINSSEELLKFVKQMLPHPPMGLTNLLIDSTQMLEQYIEHRKTQSNKKSLFRDFCPHHQFLKIYQQKLEFKKNLGSNKISKNLEMSNWKVHIISMFEALQEEQEDEELTQESNKGLDYLQSDYYGQTALYGLNYFGIRTPTLQKEHAERLAEKRGRRLIFKTTAVTKNCLQILQKIIVYINMHELPEVLISHVKKVMSYVFDKVTENVIREKISENLFYSKCLLLTNHSGKCKILFEDIMRKGSRLPQDQLRKELTHLLVVPENVVLEYARFLSTRDRLKFRMELYEAELTHLDYLTEISVADLVTNE